MQLIPGNENQKNGNSLKHSTANFFGYISKAINYIWCYFNPTKSLPTQKNHLILAQANKTIVREQERFLQNADMGDPFARRASVLLGQDIVASFNSDITTYSDFSFFKRKTQGKTLGGFYYDRHQQGWLLKDDHLEAVMIEYVTGGLFQLLINENAPQTELVLNNFEGTILIGSKLLPHFEILLNYTFDTHKYSFERNSNYQVTVGGKPVLGYIDVAWASSFLCDIDLNTDNIGLIDKGYYFQVAKIDHGCCFSFSDFNISYLQDINTIRFGRKLFDLVSFEEVYQSLLKICMLDFAKISNLVIERMRIVKHYIKASNLILQNMINGKHQIDCVDNLKWRYQQFHKKSDYILLQKTQVSAKSHDKPNIRSALFNSLINKKIIIDNLKRAKQFIHALFDINLIVEKDIDSYQEHYLYHLNIQYQRFNKIADFMLLEKTIRNHDDHYMELLVAKGLNFHEKFTPFYQIFDELGLQKFSTGIELGIKIWPERFISCLPKNIQRNSEQMLNCEDLGRKQKANQQ